MLKNKTATGANQVAIDKNSKIYYSNHKRKLPPYCKRILEARRQGMKSPNDIFVFLGLNAWSRASDFSRKYWVTLLPPNELNPENYDWIFVNGYSVLVIQTSYIQYQIIRRLAFELLKAKASIVRVLIYNGITTDLAVFKGGVE